MRWIARLFHRVPAHEVMREQLFEAERLHIEHHAAAAELHAALAGVYRGRAERLKRELSGAKAAELRIKP